MDSLGAVLAIATLASLTGVELCVAAFFHPTLERLDDAARAVARARSAVVLGRVMPLWYIAALIAAGLATGQAIVSGGMLPAALWVVCTVGLIAVIVVTVVVLVPLNTTLAASGPGGPGGEAESHRRTAARWDALHRGRTLALGVVLLVEVTATRL